MAVTGVSLASRQYEPESRRVMSQRLYKRVIAKLIVVVEPMNNGQMVEMVVESEHGAGEKQ